MPNLNEIKIYGEIGADAPTSVQFKKLTALADPAKELVVRIDSNGGSVLDAIGIRDIMASWPAGCTAIVEPLAASAASFLLTGASKVKASENSWIMLHNPKTGIDVGDDEEILAVGEQVRKFKEQMIAAYADKMKKPPEEVQAILKGETWYSAQNALDIGLVDEVLAVNRPSSFTSVDNLPYKVVASLKSSPSASNSNDKGKQAMTKSPQELIKALRSRFPKASSDFIVKAMEDGMSEDDMMQKMIEELTSKNEELTMQLKAAMEQNGVLEQEKQEVSAKVVALESTIKNLGATSTQGRVTGTQAVVRTAATGSNPGAASAKARWTAEVNACISKGMKRADAVKAVDELHPGLREEMIAEVN